MIKNCIVLKIYEYKKCLNTLEFLKYCIGILFATRICENSAVRFYQYKTGSNRKSTKSDFRQTIQIKAIGK